MQDENSLEFHFCIRGNKETTEILTKRTDTLECRKIMINFFFDKVENHIMPIEWFLCSDDWNKYITICMQTFLHHIEWKEQSTCTRVIKKVWKSNSNAYYFF
jgi:hypothetical protein